MQEQTRIKNNKTNRYEKVCKNCTISHRCTDIHRNICISLSKSQPKASVYTILNAEITDLKKTTVATGKIEPRDEILIKPQISGIIDEVYKEAGQK